MPAPGRLIAFAATRDLARAQRFYTDQLGLTLVEANPGAVVLDSDDAWTAPDGTKVAWFSDPDGNVLSLSRHPH